MVKLWRFE